jgi:ribosomal protein S18 acetylase RimI-like enzyme
MNAAIREMSIADYDVASALWAASEGVGLSDADSRETIAAYLDRNPRMSFVAVEGDVVVAAALCGTDGRRGYLHHLAVAPSHANEGLGRAVAERCLAALGERGVTRCHIHVFARNVEARNFWARTGWKYREDLVTMSKDIP